MLKKAYNPYLADIAKSGHRHIAKAIHEAQQKELKPILDVYEKYKLAIEKTGHVSIHLSVDLWQAIKTVAERNKP